MSIRARACAALVFASLAVPSVAGAQSAVDQRYATWLGLFAHGPITGDLWFWADVQPRFYESFEPQAVLLRPGLSWRFRSDLFATIGYAWTPSWSRGPEPRDWGELGFADEHRAWEQILYSPSHRASGVAGQLRLRVEQRFRTQGPFDVGVRLRLLARVSAPITRDRALLAIVWDEAFVALNDAASWQRGGFDQNRFFFGVGWQAIPSQLRFELGYVNQWLVREGPDPVNHIAALLVFLNWQ